MALNKGIIAKNDGSIIKVYVHEKYSINAPPNTGKA